MTTVAAFWIAMEVVEVVETAHERGIVHRDLKPSNVMAIERTGELGVGYGFAPSARSRRRVSSRIHFASVSPPSRRPPSRLTGRSRSPWRSSSPVLGVSVLIPR